MDVGHRLIYGIVVYTGLNKEEWVLAVIESIVRMIGSRIGFSRCSIVSEDQPLPTSLSALCHITIEKLLK